jgi:hypothetical protein
MISRNVISASTKLHCNVLRHNSQTHHIVQVASCDQNFKKLNPDKVKNDQRPMTILEVEKIQLQRNKILT